MGTVGGSRHYHGGGTHQPYKWLCPSCRAENVTPLEDGCPACGAGTPSQMNAALAQASVGPAELAARIVADQEIAPDYWLGLPGLTESAKLTVAAALAHYAEHAEPVSEQLPKDVALAWARRLLDL